MKYCEFAGFPWALSHATPRFLTRQIKEISLTKNIWGNFKGVLHLEFC